jgi:hypothetical protein
LLLALAPLAIRNSFFIYKKNCKSSFCEF